MLFSRPLPKSEEYVAYNGPPLNLSGYTTVDVKVGKKTIKNARVVIARGGKNSLIGQDWLAKLNFRVAESNKISEYNSSINNINRKPNKTEKSAELKILERKCPKSFTRQGRIVGHTIKLEFKGAKITQQKRRRVPLQLQEAVDAETKVF